MIISGLHIGWGIWRTLIYGVWASFISTGLLAFTIMSWSVGAFIGGFIGSALTPILRKNFIYVSSDQMEKVNDSVEQFFR